MQEERLKIIKQQVHDKPHFERYNETLVRDNTNCYSHALGATLPYIQIYRIGNISQRKPIDEKYTSVEEIKDLMFSDFEALNLKIEETDEETLTEKGQYKIALFVKKWANGEIADYHFWRCDNGMWTEKWKTRKLNNIDFQKEIKTMKQCMSPMQLIGIYKVSKNENT